MLKLPEVRSPLPPPPSLLPFFLSRTHRSSWFSLFADDIPSDILKQMISCHTATCEFLRQFWSAILPTPPGNVLNASTPAEKSAKAAKMVQYLSGTGAKMDGVVAAAVARGADGEKVKIVS